MPTPSDNTTIGNDELSAHTTCPPDVDRWSAWSALPEEVLRDQSDGVDSHAASPSPANATPPMTTTTSSMAHAHSVLMPSDADPMRVDSEGPTATGTTATASKQKSGQEPDGNPASTGQEGGRLSPAGEPSRLAGQPASSSSSSSSSSTSSSSVATTSSSTAALLSYEFSNVRVRCTTCMQDAS